MATKRLTVSAIVIAYNGEDYLRRALASIQAQSRSADEVILVDDGSVDGTPRVAEEYPQIRYVRQENGGPSAARNCGAHLAVGDVLAFLDSDDLWMTDKLRDEVALLEADDALDLVQGQIIDVEDHAGMPMTDELRLKALSDPYYFVNVGSLTIRRAAFVRIGGFDINRRDNEDTDWFFRAWEAGARKQFLAKPSLCYTIRSGGLSAGKGATTAALPLLLKQHRDRVAAHGGPRGTVPLNAFFPGFPDRSQRQWRGAFVSLPLRPKIPSTASEARGTAGTAAVEQQFRLARVWKNRGRWRQAAESYRKVIEQQPSHAVAHVELGKVLEQCAGPEEIAEFYDKALEAFPNEAELHKGYINAIERSAGIAAAFERYALERVDGKHIELSAASIVCCFVCRNEAKRLPYFLQYYREKGVTHFFAIDNGSTDETLSLLQEQSDVFLWRSDLSFNRANFGSVWFELVLRTHALGRWCVTVDVDELLYYPDCERVGLAELCSEMDRAKKRVLPTVLLEMYSRGPIADARCIPGQNFLETCSCFDATFYHTKVESAGPYRNLTFFFGGARERVFGASDAFCQSKVSLIKYDNDCVLAGGQHWTNLPRTAISEARGCLLHFKYFSDFSGRVQEEIRRKEHYSGALQYVQYAGRLDAEASNLTLYDPLHSVRLEGSEQLVALGIMQREPSEPGAIRTQRLEIPQIESLAADQARPFWSVMVTVYDRLTHLRRCLESILDQAESPEQMQIEVIADFVSAEMSERIRELVDDVGKGRIRFYVCPRRMGHPAIFNFCIERARGRWIHIAHDDDWLAPGYYQAMRAGIEADPELGAAFCRYALMGSAGEQKWISHLERQDPGVVDNWIERIGTYCRLAFSSIVVSRAAYETLGGFSPSVGSAFDWDMWKRISLAYRVWFEPQPLSYCGREGDSLTDGLMLTGEQIADSLLSIELSQNYLPTESSARITAAAKEHYADYAISLAQRNLTSGNYEAAFRNISGGLKASRSKAVQAKLMRTLCAWTERTVP